MRRLRLAFILAAALLTLNASGALALAVPEPCSLFPKSDAFAAAAIVADYPRYRLASLRLALRGLDLPNALPLL